MNLGGWLLLEPGTAKVLFSRYPSRSGKEAASEWELMEIMRSRGALHDLEEHRRTCVTREDFRRIRACGLNAVRLPIGYWVVLGPSHGDPYFGPALAFVDRAVKWAEEFGLQILLDLHGAPGGESGDAPCGRQQADGQWQWRQWRMQESMRALRVLAARYRDSPAVTGVEVCNEPSKNIPAAALCRYYSEAVRCVRDGGMDSECVTVVLPLFQRSAKDFVDVWRKVFDGKDDNICFDFHHYHCFGNDWNGKTFAQHLRSVQQNALELRTLPAVVGEWSLALGLAAEKSRLPVEQMRHRFGHVQLAAYQEASHGWFFWNWCDAHGAEWNWQQSYSLGFICRHARSRLPSWDGEGEDPLEEATDPTPSDPAVRFGDAVFLRTFHGRYIDLGGPKEQASARWADRGTWQRFTFLPSADQSPPGPTRAPAVVKHGDVVRLLAHTGHFLGTDGGKVAECPDIFSDDKAEFVVHVEGSGGVQHRRSIYLESRATACVMDVDGDGSAQDVGARWRDFGKWQRLAVEKVFETEDANSFARAAPRRDLFAGQPPTESSTSRMSPKRRQVAMPESTPCSKSRRRSTSVSPEGGPRCQAVACVTPDKLSLRWQPSPILAKDRRRRSSAAGSLPKQAPPSGVSEGHTLPGHGQRTLMGGAPCAIIPVWRVAGA